MCYARHFVNVTVTMVPAVARLRPSGCTVYSVYPTVRVYDSYLPGSWSHGVIDSWNAASAATLSSGLQALDSIGEENIIRLSLSQHGQNGAIG